VSPAQLFFYGCIAFVLALIPTFLYVTVFDLGIMEYAVLYFPVTCGVAAALVISYNTLAAASVARLSGIRKNSAVDHKKLGLKKEELDEVKENVIFRESITWSIFFNNLVFILSFLFVAFYVLRAIPAVYNYVISMALASVLVWQMSTALAKTK